MTSTALELAQPPLANLTPKQIVSELDKHVVGQAQAKRAVAIALRNRWRRQQLPPELADEVVPKNILMIGPTGVGKTEIARRLAKLVQAPFHKIEATKFTEVGYVGRDVDSIIRDLMEMAVATVQSEMKERVWEEAYERAEERLLQLLVPPPTPTPGANPSAVDGLAEGPSTPTPTDPARTREKFRDKLRAGKLDDRMVEIEVEDTSPRSFEMFTPQGVEEVGINLKEMMPGLFGRRQRQEVRVSEAREILQQQEAEKLVERRLVIEEARQRVEQSGIVFLDEMDKICVRESGRGAEVSREGVQRDLLPIVEGTTINTKYGMVKTDHILFIGAGSFHSSKPSDMIPELQGRFPIRVELNALTEADFVRILTEPESALTKQYVQLLSTEKVDIEFTDDAVVEIARMAVVVNTATENIGARRLATLAEKVLEEVSFEAPDMAGVHLRIDKSYVEKALGDIVEDEDLSRYVL